MTQFLAWFAVIVVVACIVFFGLAVWLKPEWSDDKPYTDEHGWLVDCGCRGCGR